MFILIPVKIPRYDCNFCFNGRWLEDAHEAGSMPAGSSAQLSLAEPGLVVSTKPSHTKKPVLWIHIRIHFLLVVYF